MELATSFSWEVMILKSVNKVRMLHEVIHLSNITTANEAHIDPPFLISDPSPEQRNEYNWTKKHHVLPADFTTWRQFINHIYASNDFRLQQSLRHWIHPTRPVLRTTWNWFLDNTHNILYKRVNDSFTKHRPRHRQSWIYKYDCLYTHHLLDHALLLSVHPADQFIKLLNTNINCRDPLPQETPTISTFTRENIIETIRQHLPPWATQWLGTTPSLSKLYQDILNGTAVLVSDSSHFPLQLKAGAAWCIYPQLTIQNSYVEEAPHQETHTIMTATAAK